MQMKELRITIIAGVLITMLTASQGCQKEDTTFSGAKVVSETNLRQGFTDIYTYNANGDVAQINNSSGDVVLFTYNGDTVNRQTLSQGTVVSSAIVYLLGGDKYTDTSYGLYQSQNSSSSYIYDGNGQLTRQTNYSYGNVTTTNNYTLTAKNVTTLLSTTSGTQTRYEYSYTTTTNTIGVQNFGMGFMGVGSLYLPQTRVKLNQNSDTLEVLTYRYGLDDNSQVTLKTSYNAAGVLVDSIAYSY